MKELQAKTSPSQVGSRATFKEAPGSPIEIQLSVEVTERISTNEWKGKVRTSTVQGELTLNQEVTMTRKSGNIFTVQ